MGPVSARLDKSWSVLACHQTPEGNRCVDVFARPDATFGFEEFRRDPEDLGVWTPLQYFSTRRYASADEATEAACDLVPWLRDALKL